MKYQEFIKLRQILESQNSSVDEFIGRRLFEAEPNELNTEKPRTVSLATRWGRMKKKLNKTGKTLQSQVISKIVERYYQPVLDNKAEILNQVVKLSEQKKKPQEIVQALQNNAKISSQLQLKQLEIINNVAEKFISNTKQRVDGIIAKSKMKDRNKLKIENYWELLVAQIRLNFYQHIIDLEKDFVAKNLSNNKELITVANALLKQKNLQVKVEERRKAAETKKAEVEKVDKEMESGESKDDGGEKIEIGDVRHYKSKEGNDLEITINKKNEDGSYQVTSKGGTTFIINKDKAKEIGKKVQKKIIKKLK